MRHPLGPPLVALVQSEARCLSSPLAASRHSNGTYAPGNPGRPRGNRNKATEAALALLEGEAEAITRKVVDMALAGDTTAVAKGDLTPTEGAQIMALVETFRRTLETSEMAGRLADLEEAIRGAA